MNKIYKIIILFVFGCQSLQLTAAQGHTEQQKMVQASVGNAKRPHDRIEDDVEAYFKEKKEEGEIAQLFDELQKHNPSILPWKQIVKINRTHYGKDIVDVEEKLRESGKSFACDIKKHWYNPEYRMIKYKDTDFLYDEKYHQILGLSSDCNTINKAIVDMEDVTKQNPYEIIRDKLAQLHEKFPSIPTWDSIVKLNVETYGIDCVDMSELLKHAEIFFTHRDVCSRIIYEPAYTFKPSDILYKEKQEISEDYDYDSDDNNQFNYGSDDDNQSNYGSDYDNQSDCGSVEPKEQKKSDAVIVQEMIEENIQFYPLLMQAFDSFHIYDLQVDPLKRYLEKNLHPYECNFGDVMREAENLLLNLLCKKTADIFNESNQTKDLNGFLILRIMSEKNRALYGHFPLYQDLERAIHSAVITIPASIRDKALKNNEDLQRICMKNVAVSNQPNVRQKVPTILRTYSSGELFIKCIMQDQAQQIQDLPGKNFLEKAQLLLEQDPNLINFIEPLNTKTPLIYACSHPMKTSTTSAMITWLLDAGADINASDKENKTPLMSATIVGNATAVNILLSRGADRICVSRNGWTPLYIAANKGYEEIVDLLVTEHEEALNMSNTVDGTPLMVAAMQGHLGIVKKLIEQGSKLEIKDKHGWTALMKAADKGNLEIVQLLLDSGAVIDDADMVGFTPLMLAVKSTSKKSFEVVKLLIEANPHLVHLLIDKKSQDMKTALYYAVESGNKEKVAYLLDCGADRMIADKKNQTPLMLAQQKGIRDIIKLLQ